MVPYAQVKTLLVAAAMSLSCTAMVPADTLSEMTEKIDRAAAAMGAPHDAVTPALRDAYPGVDVTGHVDCVARHATPSELAELSGGKIGAGATPSEIAAAIAARPETVECISSGGLSALPK